MSDFKPALVQTRIGILVLTLLLSIASETNANLSYRNFNKPKAKEEISTCGRNSDSPYPLGKRLDQIGRFRYDPALCKKGCPKEDSARVQPLYTRAGRGVSRVPILDLSEQARNLYRQARFAEAISVYQEIIKNNPKEFEAYLNLVYLYKDLAEYKQAIEVIKKALESFKDNRLKMLLGRLYYLDGRSQEAIFHLEQLLPFYPEDSELLLQLGLCYEDIGNISKAEAYYLEAIRLKPDDVLAYLKLGNIYYAKLKYKEAIQAYQKVISLDPSVFEVRPKLAECFTKLGEFREAYAQYAKCVAINPDDKSLQKRLGQIKAKLGEDFFKQERIKTLQRRKRKSIQVMASRFAERAPQVRVGIGRFKGSIEFKCGAPFEIIDKNGNYLFEGKEESIYSLVFDKRAGPVRNSISNRAGIQLRDSQGNVLAVNLNTPFLIKNKPRPSFKQNIAVEEGRGKSENSVISIFDIPSGLGNFWAGWHDQQYRGIIEVSLQDNDVLQLVNLINLEEYLYGILPSEMPADWPKQALCAQAIAARTWAIKNLTRHSKEGFDFCSDVHCQVYKAVGAETPRTSQAVDETAGLILTNNNQPIDIFYSNNCGGCTQEGVVDAYSLEISPLKLEEYFRQEPEAFCNLKGERRANFRWMRLYSREELEAMLGKSNIDVGELLKIIPQRRANSAHLMGIRIEGTKNTLVIEGENNIRKILGNLRSSAFKIEVKYNQQNQAVEFIFYGGGFGHGRGLCQTGAKGMAIKGYNYLEILRHYYPEAQIKKIH